MFERGSVSLAIPQFRAVIRQRPSDAEAHYALANCLERTGKFKEAIAHYREALRLRPDWPDALNDLAWLLATSSDQSIRDPQSACELGQTALKLNQDRQPISMDTMAASLAARGEFARAIRAQEEAIKSATAGGADPKWIGQLENRLALYRQHQPFVQTPAATQPSK
jgi:cytochrome c-type biogenesis protein CcmH/NrfG